MSTHSTDGREWAKLSALKPGDKVLTDSGFSCGMSNKTLTVQVDDLGLFVPCGRVNHYLDGQLADDGDHLVGIWLAA
ncbi:MAG: hypothetical protein E5V63_25495 [Mesorhizobium sp.]|nr:MAG: hypothetical protein E5V63_25495 [Mesorhizobium sp.]